MSGPRPQRELPKRLSPTALSTFERCPQRFEFAYREHRQASVDLTAPLLVGQLVHAALADFFRPPARERASPTLVQLLRAHWAASPDRELAFLGTSEEATWGERTLTALTAFCDEQDLATSPLHLEHWVRASLPGGQQLFGRVDRIDAERDGVSVTDYKTGRCFLATDDEVRDEVASQLYAWCVSRHLGKPVCSVRLLYVMEGIERVWQLGPDDLDWAQAQLEQRVSDISETQHFEPMPGFQCGYCPFVDDCPGLDRPVGDLDRDLGGTAQRRAARLELSTR